MKGSKVCLHFIMDCEVQAHSSLGRWRPIYVGIFFRDPPLENFAYCYLVGDVGLWASHMDLIASFGSPSPSEWTLALNTWDNK